MAHTNSTPNLELSQFISTDKPTWLGDVNGDMLKIDTAVAAVGATASGASSKADTAISTANAASDTATDAATLANTANTNAQSALTTAGNAATAANAAGELAQTAKTTADGADDKADANATNIGDLTTLTTTAKNNLVAAINEVNAKPAGGGTAADISYDNTDSGLVAETVQAAIDELVTMINPTAISYIIVTNGTNVDGTVTKDGQQVGQFTTLHPYEDGLIIVNYSNNAFHVTLKVAALVDTVATAANTELYTVLGTTSSTYTASIIATNA